jgi:hypothetical protein
MASILIDDRIALHLENGRRQSRAAGRNAASAVSTRSLSTSISALSTSPAKPMKASDISPAVTRAMAGPERHRHIRHRDALAHRGEQGQHQGEADRGAEAVDPRFDEAVLAWTLSRATPSTAQLVVMSGRKIPSTW